MAKKASKRKTADEQGTNMGRPGDEPATISEASAPFPTDAPDDRQTEKAGQDAGNAGTERIATQSADSDRSEIAGDVSDLDSAGSGNPIETELSSRVSRLPGEGRSSCHERLRRLARAAGLPRGQGPGTAYNWALEQTNRLFAKLIEPIEPSEEPGPDFQQLEISQPPTIAVSPAPSADDGSVSGLADLPPGWPELPANAQLQVEIAWVTANRLRVRSGTGVDLSKALSPAPSYSALSWLETSILFPAKFADISVKATAQDDSEREFIKREKLAIEEIRSILAEMIEAED